MADLINSGMCDESYPVKQRYVEMSSRVSTREQLLRNIKDLLVGLGERLDRETNNKLGPLVETLTYRVFNCKKEAVVAVIAAGMFLYVNIPDREPSSISWRKNLKEFHPAHQQLYCLVTFKSLELVGVDW